MQPEAGHLAAVQMLCSCMHAWQDVPSSSMQAVLHCRQASGSTCEGRVCVDVRRQAHAWLVLVHCQLVHLRSTSSTAGVSEG